MGRIVAIANQKGGVGKTTTAVNLAASLAIAEQRVLLIDLDPQGNATSGLGHPHREVERGTYEMLIGEATLDEILLGTELTQLSVAPSSPDLAAASLELVDEETRFTRLRDAVRAQRDDWDWILIDCPPSLGLLTINALTAADTVLVPMQCEYYALEGLGDLIDTVQRIKASLNARLELDGVLLTMWDPRSNLSHDVAGEVQKHFRVYETRIPRNVRLAEAPSHGKPVILYDASSRGSHGYLNLAREILDATEAA